MHVVFVCDAAAARAPLAEAIGRHLAPQHAFTGCGLRPSHVRPEAHTVLEEEGIPTSGLRARGLNAVDWDDVDLAVALAPEASEAALPGPARRLSWHLPDPCAAPEEERLEVARSTRDELTRRIRALVAEHA